MTDDRAIELFVRDGGRAQDWPNIDEQQRLPYRLKAAEEARTEAASAVTKRRS